MVTMVTTKYHSPISDASNFSSVKFYIRIRSTDRNIGDCFMLTCAYLSFLKSHNLLFFSLYKTYKKTFSVFLSFSVVKLPKSRSFKLNISRTAWPILMTLVSFHRIFNGLSDEINLFWRCSSPLRIKNTLDHGSIHSCR